MNWTLAERIMGNPFISELGFIAEVGYSTLAVLTALLCFFHFQQTYYDPDRVVPWCHIRRIGLAGMTTMMFASAVRHGGHEPTAFQGLFVLFVFTLLLGSVYGRDATGRVKKRSEAAGNENIRAGV